MVAGYERINERTRQPNPLIGFIKPLEPVDPISLDILQRIAAIVFPVMRDNYLQVTSFEEFPPNKEFWGRNFNHGEVVQLVLKSPHTGQWLPMSMIESVMLHELAHCKEMNHGKNFHKLRLGYMDELRGLKGKGYTGEGLWGKGRALHPSAMLPDREIDQDELPADLCGGTFRKTIKRRKKAEEKDTISYAERKQRRIEKKFGKEGVGLGTDEEERIKLEGGKKVKGKPRVAASVRARELRAAAALKRFGQQAKEEVKEEMGKDSDATSSDEEEEKVMVKVEDDEDERKGLKREFEELQACAKPSQDTDPTVGKITAKGKEIGKEKGLFCETGEDEATPQNQETNLKTVPESKSKYVDSDAANGEDKTPTLSKSLPQRKIPTKSAFKPKTSKLPAQVPNPPQIGSPKLTKPKPKELFPTAASFFSPTESSNPSLSYNTPPARACNICTTPHTVESTICTVCANVLSGKIASWKCNSAICKEGEGIYRNSEDVTFCGVCGTRKGP